MAVNKFQIYTPGIRSGFNFRIFVIEVDRLEAVKRRLIGDQSLEINSIRNKLIKRYWKIPHINGEPFWILDKNIEASNGWQALRAAEALIERLKKGEEIPPDFDKG